MLKLSVDKGTLRHIRQFVLAVFSTSLQFSPMIERHIVACI